MKVNALSGSTVVLLALLLIAEARAQDAAGVAEAYCARRPHVVVRPERPARGHQDAGESRNQVRVYARTRLDDILIHRATA